ncbi:hypothetical protein, partial [Bacillus sp. UNC438CL73TsuS30]|uniref:hypothetical protein n=1 Tax=Bacillus sp. UNC438CL73TsuS30 TaxID=1340434 RepID=UPI0005537BFF
GKIKRHESGSIPNSCPSSCLNFVSNFLGSDQKGWFTQIIYFDNHHPDGSSCREKCRQHFSFLLYIHYIQKNSVIKEKKRSRFNVSGASPLLATIAPSNGPASLGWSGSPYQALPQSDKANRVSQQSETQSSLRGGDWARDVRTLALFVSKRRPSFMISTLFGRISNQESGSLGSFDPKNEENRPRELSLWISMDLSALNPFTNSFF